MSGSLMSRRLLAHLVSYTCHPSRLNRSGGCASASLRDICSSPWRCARTADAQHHRKLGGTTSLHSKLRHVDVSSQARSSSTLSDLRKVVGLESLNDELAEALLKDRAAARVQLYNEMMCHIHMGDQPPREQAFTRLVPRSTDISDVSHLSIDELKSKLRPCVSQEELLHGSEETLRLRLAALLHYTGLQESVPVDLRDSSSMKQLKDTFAAAAQAGMVLSYKAVKSSPNARRRAWRSPVSLAEARRRTKENLSEGPPEATVPIDSLAQLLVDAGMEDVVSLDMTVLEAQRDCDSLLLATGRSPQHAFAGAKAVRFVLKQARKGAQMHREVVIAHDASTPWYSVNSGGISVHCMSRDVRAELDLETLWGTGTNETWWQRGPGALTLDTIRVEDDV